MSIRSPSAAYTFTPTQDWFTFNVARWKDLFKYVVSSTPRVLEIGTWEGRSTVFLADNLCCKGGSIVCIDHFDLGRTEAGIERRRKVISNLAQTKRPHRIIEMFSFPALAMLLEEELLLEPEQQGYDWIYIDGSHEADDTLLDGELVWRLAKKGAVIIFDDYHWDAQLETSMHHPKRGIDAFMQLHAGQYDQLFAPETYQMVLRKTSDMRIGFLTSPASMMRQEYSGLGYRMNVAMAIDDSYAIGAAVVLHSLAKTTSGAITVYIIDSGLDEEVKAKLQSSIDRDDVDIVFRQLPQNCLASELGGMWVQIDVLSLLPVERALYLDSDILVRSSLRPLWETSLEDYELGAVQDIGFPSGTDDSAVGIYFNAGVLLLDLARIRVDLKGLKERCMAMRDAKYHGQDALNVHFVGKWKHLDGSWNAQGLGTYANYPSPARDAIDLKAMKSDPKIVHFTGPVHPSMAQVLDPYVQPFTAKPWGFAGAPGNPFVEEWRDTLKKTAWASHFTSEGFKKMLCEKRKEAIAAGIEELDTRIQNFE